MKQVIDVLREPGLSQYDALVVSVKKLNELHEMLKIQRDQIGDLMETLEGYSRELDGYLAETRRSEVNIPHLFEPGSPHHDKYCWCKK